jgi:hypothetical protein
MTKKKEGIVTITIKCKDLQEGPKILQLINEKKYHVTKFEIEEVEEEKSPYDNRDVV